LRKLLIALGVIVVLLIAAALVIPAFLPVDDYKQEIAERVRAQTGRDLAINGDVRLSLLPNVALEVDDVVLGNAPDGRADEMASLDELRIDVKPLPLLEGELSIDRFVLVDPVINLEILPDGRANWQLGPTADAKSESDGAGAMDSDLAQLHLGNARLENGRITYFDATTGAEQVLSDVNLTVDLERLSAPFSATGSFVWQGETIDVNVGADDIAGLREGGTTKADLEIASDPLDLDFSGTLTGGESVAAAGETTIDVPSVRRLMEWIGNPMAAGDGFEHLELKGKLSASTAGAAFNDATVALDDNKGTGQFAIDFTDTVPTISGALDLEALDLEPYVPAPPDSQSTEQGPIEEWSDEPYDFAALHDFNADLVITAQSIKVRHLTMGPGAFSLSIANGRMAGDLEKLEFYDGHGKGSFVLDASGDVPMVQKDIALTGVRVGPFLADALGNDRLTGTGGLKFEITASGQSERDMVRNMSGAGRLDLRDGAVKGIDLAAMFRSAGAAFEDNALGEGHETDFAELSASFTIEDGILRNDDLSLSSPLLRAGGAGTVDLSLRTVDYKVTPELAASTEDQGGTQDATGATVPVIISGPWSDLGFRPDLAAAGVTKHLTGDAGVSPGDDAGGPSEKTPSVLEDTEKAIKDLLGD
jgi:AsmA protein